MSQFLNTFNVIKHQPWKRTMNKFLDDASTSTFLKYLKFFSNFGVTERRTSDTIKPQKWLICKVSAWLLMANFEDEVICWWFSFSALKTWSDLVLCQDFKHFYAADENIFRWARSRSNKFHHFCDERIITSNARFKFNVIHREAPHISWLFVQFLIYPSNLKLRLEIKIAVTLDFSTAIHVPFILSLRTCKALTRLSHVGRKNVFTSHPSKQ